MQKGRSMVEMLGVLIIITVLTIGALAGWKGAQQKMDVAEAQNEIALIEQDISNLYNWARAYPRSPVYCYPSSNHESCSGIGELPSCGKSQSFMATLCSEKVFPSGCVPGNCENNDCTAYHPFDRSIPNKAGTYGVCFTDDGYLVIELKHLPSREICNELKVSASQLEHYEGADCIGSDENMVTLTITFR